MSGRSIRYAHLNVQSLFPKLNAVRALIREHKIDILAITESWLNADVRDVDIFVAGYVVERRDRGARGGGICFYIRDDFKYYVHNTSDSIEQLWFVFSFCKEQIVLGAIYNPPSFPVGDFVDEFEASLASCMAVGDRVICCGDFNIDMLAPRERGTVLLGALLDSMEANQLIATPTRVTDTTAKVIDLIITLDNSIIVDSGVISCHLSDHDMIYSDFLLKVADAVPDYRMYRNLSNCNDPDFHNALRSIPFNQIYFLHDINDKVGFLNKNLLYLFDLFAPLRRVKIAKPPPPWLTDNLRFMMSLRDKAKASY